MKACPVCETYVPAGVRVCPECHHEFPPPPVQLAPTPSTAPILSNEQEPRWVAVSSVEYSYHEPRPPKTIPTLKATYFDGFRLLAQEWVCLEHDGFARTKAEQWWAQRSPDRAPHTITQALTLTDDLRTPTEIALVPDLKNPRYSRVVGVRFAGDAPTRGSCHDCTHFAGALCIKWDAEPPADVIATGCEAFAPDSTFELPF